MTDFLVLMYYGCLQGSPIFYLFYFAYTVFILFTFETLRFLLLAGAYLLSLFSNILLVLYCDGSIWKSWEWNQLSTLYSYCSTLFFLADCKLKSGTDHFVCGLLKIKAIGRGYNQKIKLSLFKIYFYALSDAFYKI